MNYLVLVTMVITPASAYIFFVMKIVVFPKFKEIFAGMEAPINPVFPFVDEHGGALFLAQMLIMLLLWIGVFLFMIGPRAAAWFPMLDRLHYWLPWTRNRMRRDFSALLAVLLDAGVPESEALSLAGECSANHVFRQRAERAAEGLRQGHALTEAVGALDDSGEFRWRLKNAAHGGQGFFRALAGWHEWLDARAFQQEQAAAHGITTALVLWSGLLVGAIVASVFLSLISIVNGGVLW